MATSTLDAVYKKLENNRAFYENPVNRDELLKLTKELDATNSTGSVTLVYSGSVTNGISGQVVVDAVLESGDDIRLIDKTDAGDFLKSEAFRLAVARSFGFNTTSEFDKAPRDHAGKLWLYHGTDSPWAEASALFAATAEGEVRTLTGGAEVGRIFQATELKILLDNPKVTTIDGIPREILRTYSDEQAFKAIRAQSEALSAELVISVDSDGKPVEINKRYLIDTQDYFSATGVEVAPPASQFESRKLAVYFDPARLETHREGLQVLKEIQEKIVLQSHVSGPEFETQRITALKALDKLGVLGDVLALGLAAGAANAAYAEGDTAKGNAILQDWATDFVGGLAGGIAAGKVAASALTPLFLTGPAGAILAGGLTLLAGLAGGIYGGSYFTELIRNLQDTFALTKNTVNIYSPLVLDLDGDGVETVSWQQKEIYFDHAADGFAERTAWAGKDDGILVRDLNGNGRIDTGRELFGDNTLVAGVAAASGYEALKALNSNGDGLISSADAAWSQLKVWKDANSNGITEAGELLTMADAKVKNIRLNYTQSDFVDAQGNAHLQEGTYLRTDGVVRKTSDVWFNVDPLFAKDLTTTLVSPDIAILFDIKGTGLVSDLHQVIAKDTSGQLFTQVKGLQTKAMGTGSLSALNDDLSALILKWTGVNPASINTFSSSVANGHVAVLEKLTGLSYKQLAADGVGTPDRLGLAEAAYWELHGYIAGRLLTTTRFASVVEEAKLAFDAATQTFKLDFGQSAPVFKALMDNLAGAERLQTLAYLKSAWFGSNPVGNPSVEEVFNALKPLDPILADLWKSIPTIAVSGSEVRDEVNLFKDQNHIYFGFGGADRIASSDGDDWLYGGTGDDQINGGNGNDILSGDEGADQLNGESGADTYLFGKGFGKDTVLNYDSEVLGENADTILLGAGIAATDVKLTRSFDDLLIGINGTTDQLKVLLYFQDDATTSNAIENIKFSDGTNWDIAGVKSKVLVGTASTDDLTGYATNDTIDGGAGNDFIYARTGADSILGGAGNDRVHGEDGNDVLHGGDGSDYLYGGEGNDMLDGGAGNDQLQGENGADTYLFGSGFGQDTVSNYDGDALGVNADTILFGTGITATGVKLTRYSDDLFIGLNGTNDQLKVSFYFQDDAKTSNAVENIKFADGTIWNIAKVKANAMAGTSANDQLYGYASNDTINGGAGNDTIYAGLGADSILGGAGNDQIHGDDGNDVVNGGDGVDYLYGGKGNDTIIGASGADLIQLESGSDVLVFNSLSGADGIMDYSVNADTIQLSKAMFAALVGSIGDQLTTAQFQASTNGLASNTSARVIYNTSNGQLSYDADGSAAGTAVLIGTFQNNPTLNAGEFFLVA